MGKHMHSMIHIKLPSPPPNPAPLLPLKMLTHIQAHTCTLLNVCVCVCVCMHTCLCLCIRVCFSVYLCVSVLFWLNISTQSTYRQSKAEHALIKYSSSLLLPLSSSPSTPAHTQRESPTVRSTFSLGSLPGEDRRFFSPKTMDSSVLKYKLSPSWRRFRAKSMWAPGWVSDGCESMHEKKLSVCFHCLWRLFNAGFPTDRFLPVLFVCL